MSNISNIKDENMKYEVTMQHHPNWKTCCYTVEYDFVKYDCNIYDLRHKTAVYILADYQNDIPEFYGGQVGVRPGGAWKRIQEHTTDKFKNMWQKAYIFVVKDVNKDEIVDGITYNSVSLDALEDGLVEYLRGIREIKCVTKRTKHPQLSSIGQSYLDEIKQYIQRILINRGIIADTSNTDSMSEKIKDEKIQIETINLGDYDETGDYTTPENTVRNMVNMIPEELLTAEAKFFDPACKDGLFLKILYERLMNSKSELKAYPDEFNRHSHIIDEQLYGIAISKESYGKTLELLYGKKNNDDYSSYRNIRFGGNKYIDKIKQFNFSKGIDSKTVEQVKRYIFIDIFNNQVWQNDEKKDRELRDMKFSVVIGNPPYSDNEDRGDINSGNSLYPKFMYIGMIVGEYSCMIVPSGWMTMNQMSGVKCDELKYLRENSNRISEIHDFHNAGDIFEGVTIPTGVCYYLMGEQESPSCSHSIDGIECEAERLLYDKDLDVLFRDKKAIDIISKIEQVDGKEYPDFADECAGGKHYFDDGDKIMTSTWNDYRIVKNGEYSIKYYLKSSNKKHKNSLVTVCDGAAIPNLGYAWVSEEQIPTRIHADDYKRHKLIIGQAFTANSKYVLDVPEYIGNNSVCSQSYIPVFSPHDSEEECLTIAKYMQTKFFRYLVNILKSGQNLSNRIFKLVPMQDFTSNSNINWNESLEKIDEQLYEKYKLTSDERKHIDGAVARGTQDKAKNTDSEKNKKKGKKSNKKSEETTE